MAIKAVFIGMDKHLDATITASFLQEERRP